MPLGARVAGREREPPAAQAYYDSIVEQLAENLGADIIKGDCFFCRPCYSSEMLLMSNAVKARPEPITLYLSPGGGAQVSDGALTLTYFTNPRALALNRRAEVVPTTVSYAGNCTCTGGSGSCTILHGPGDHPAQPCDATWVAVVGAPGAWTALMQVNIGEDVATSATGFEALGLPATPANVYRVEDVWSGATMGDFLGDERITVELRPHASVLLQVTRLA